MSHPPDDKPRFYDDDGNELNPDLVPKPTLCVSCAKDDDPKEEVLCLLNRLDQQDEAEFKCFAFVPKDDDGTLGP